MSLEHAIRDRLDHVRSRIAAASARAGRDPGGIQLVAVSKTFGVEHVRAAAAAGQTVFGENRVQEALEKMLALDDPALSWHLVGHLQSNKARKAPAFACIESIDSVDLLCRVDRAVEAEGRRIEALVQVDLAGEATKHGARPDELPSIFAAARGCHAVQVTGLMLLPPYEQDPERVRPYFRRLAELGASLAGSVPPEMLVHLSMGMSHDFDVAIEEGATIVRVGTAIFGSRPPGA